MKGICKFVALVCLVFVSANCGRSSNKIEGNWKLVKVFENGTETVNTEDLGFQYLKNGELKLYRNNKRVGLGLYYYKLDGDNLFLTNVEIDTAGKIDTLGTKTGLVDIKYDSMKIMVGDNIYYYKKENH